MYTLWHISLSGWLLSVDEPGFMQYGIYTILHAARLSMSSEPIHIHLARPDITRYLQNHFATSSRRVYTTTDIKSIHKSTCERWGLPSTVTLSQFTEFLLNKTELRPVYLQPEEHRSVLRYVWGEPSPYGVALSLRPKAYLSHATAVFLHALTDQMPTTIYVNHEQTAKPRPRMPLTQERLDFAFSRPQRQSRYIFSYKKQRIVLLSGKYTNRLGVATIQGPEGETLDATTPERTLIDIAVRPAYAGGIYQVLRAFKSAIDKISTDLLIKMLKELDYVYPYHQVIGFYMERAGYPASSFEKLRDLGLTFNFYLAHGLRNVVYESRWRLFHPKGF